ncbi:MAG: DUF72 domain-containing protein [Thermoprotei archaeon]|nr:MAG: DUF72 domain-containing protein [Thermoprotei archaeon]
MRIYIGTSGWNYFWNPDGLRWYVENTRFNSIELNMSFYGFPRPKQVLRWKREGNELRWVIKVHRSITHLRKLSEVSLKTWHKFRDIFKELETNIDYYLFQFPPSLGYSDKILSRILNFHKIGNVGDKMAIEPRHESWFRANIEEKLSSYGIVIVTPDSPMFNGLPFNRIYVSSDVVYLRIHGRSEWYSHIYSSDELNELAEKVLETGVERAYIFLNNDHGMLPNGNELVDIFLKKGCSVSREN